MIGAAVAILLWLLPLQVNGLITADAKCLPGFQWTFSSIGQSPCDVAAELASVCNGGSFILPPLPLGRVYVGPPVGTAIQTNCRCSSVFYSMMSACSFCQGRDYLPWSIYKTNCTTVQLTVYNQDIPVGVRVPAYAYQDVSVSDTFNLILAQSMGGVESTRPPQASPTSATPAAIPAVTLEPIPAVPAQSNSGTSGKTNNTPAIVGGVVGGVVGLGLIAALIIFLILRSKQKTQKYNSSFQLNPSIIHSMSIRPGSPYKPDDRSADPNLNVPSNITGSSAHKLSPQTMPKASQYSGMPEF